MLRTLARLAGAAAQAGVDCRKNGIDLGTAASVIKPTSKAYSIRSCPSSSFHSRIMMFFICCSFRCGGKVSAALRGIVTGSGQSPSSVSKHFDSQFEKACSLDLTSLFS
jgi:hypothetical protein